MNTIDPATTASMNGVHVFTPEEVEAEQAAGELLHKWQLRSLADAYAPRPPLHYVIQDLLPAPSLAVVYGGPGSLKSMLLADLATCVVAGERWLEPLPGKKANSLAVSQTPVLWIDFDNGKRRTDERVEAFARARNLPADAPMHYVSMPNPWLNAGQLPMMVELAKLVCYLKARLVIVDNLGLITGDAEENSAAMAQVMGNLRWLCEEAECAVIVVHHQRKSGGQNDKGIRKGETLRGHSSIEAALDLALLVERKEGSDSVVIIPTKVRGYRAFDFLGGMFTYAHHDGTTDMATARFWGEEALSADERERLTIHANVKAILRAAGPMAQGDLVTEIRDTLASINDKAPGVNRVRGLIKAMADEGIISASGRGTKVTYALI